MTQSAGIYAGGGYPTSASSVYLREDLIDVVMNLDKNKEAAVFMSVGKTTASGFSHAWELDSIPATVQTGFVEGEDWAAPTISGRTRLTNYVQTFKYNIAASMDALEYSLKGRAPGVGNEYQYQVNRHLMALEQSIDARVVSNTANITGVDPAASGTIGLLCGLRGFQVTATNTVGLAEVAAATNACQLQVGGAWSRTKFLALHEFMYGKGANPDTLVVDPGVKSDITQDILGESSSATTVRQLHFDGSTSEFTQNVQFLRTDFGRVAVLVDRFVPVAATTTNARTGGAFFLFDRAQVRLAFWRPIRHYPLPPNGDHMRGYVHSAVTMELLAPNALGVGYNVTT
jgi:hypothetical protein